MWILIAVLLLLLLLWRQAMMLTLWRQVQLVHWPVREQTMRAQGDERSGWYMGLGVGAGAGGGCGLGARAGLGVVGASTAWSCAAESECSRVHGQASAHGGLVASTVAGCKHGWVQAQLVIEVWGPSMLSKSFGSEVDVPHHHATYNVDPTSG
ncbi:hypothetical protein FIBSPDRAFT_896341 [Athelia psychrophila]|uniref:Secreted protein n=1 Tax=Athelia psychrophila TaxID=1759441 RepID=A0A166DH59_9AGAM|nr:hypothetical protein FIBSPDRAFT_896341 [Fibularhizoctonia sp. CBS 109695]